mmetsp:Transcript_4042/g.15221  ORF Transcript_4042/g.15221 Transcript_4042/m.15221 type:complete len:99 (+) Transcript_4042:229-525(+)
MWGMEETAPKKSRKAGAGALIGPTEHGGDMPLRQAADARANPQTVCHNEQLAEKHSVGKLRPKTGACEPLLNELRNTSTIEATTWSMCFIYNIERTGA